jgi:hypothetical protein
VKLAGTERLQWVEVDRRVLSAAMRMTRSAVKRVITEEKLCAVMVAVDVYPSPSGLVRRRPSPPLTCRYVHQRIPMDPPAGTC